MEIQINRLSRNTQVFAFCLEFDVGIEKLMVMKFFQNKIFLDS